MTDELTQFDEPRLIDYRAMELGRKRRHPRGVIRVCPECGTNGLRQVYSWRRGFYKVVYHHTATATHKHFAPIVDELCSLTRLKLKDLPQSERDLGVDV